MGISMEKTVHISVVIPVYNESGSLRNIFDFLSQQKFSDMEVIFVIDGKTTDDSIRIIESIVEKNGKYRCIVQNGNGKLGEARNMGLENAEGKYVWFLDADDRPYPDFMNTMYELSEKYGTDVTQCNFIRSFSYDTAQPRTEYEPVVMTGNEALRERAYERIPVTAWSMLLKRDFLLDNGIRFKEGGYAEDVDFIYRVLEKCKNYCYYRRPLYLYYQNPDSICFTKQNERGQGEISVYSELEKHFESAEFGKTFGRRSALMRIRSATHMDKNNFLKYVRSDGCKEMMKKHLSDPVAPEYVWVSLFPTSYYIAVNLFVKFVYCGNGRIFGRRLKKR